jgi:hypothetical protein
MNASSILSAGLFAFASLAAGTASATIINESYYPPGETYIQPANSMSRTDMKAATRMANSQITARQPRTEFGAGSHDRSPEVMNKQDVKNSAKTFTHTGGTHAPFTY